MSEANKSQELSLVRNTLWTTALIILVFGLAAALDAGGDTLIASGYMQRGSQNHLCLQLVATVAKASEVALILVLIVAHALVAMVRTIRYLVDAIREVFTRE